ncbi:MAG: endo-1,4-beta-xylanase [Planctomycetota bacterium]|nr:MAG: endo-1,4-beta-xylanase [Planctomycetota bacterium]
MRKLIFLLAFMANSALGAQGQNEILDRADRRIHKYRTGQVVIQLLDPSGKPVAAGRQIKIEQTRHAFLFGCNIFLFGKIKKPADSAAYQQRFAELFNFATLPFYWWYYEPRQGQHMDARTEAILEWCRRHNITAKGHPLAWNYSDPKWISDHPDRAMQLQFARIGRCVGKFKGQLDLWDVVNEATHWDRETCWKQSPILTQGIARVGVGTYIRSAFQAARKANPGATLIINDYRTDPEYQETVLKELVDRTGRPLYDVIGIQSHQHGAPWPVEKIWEVCERFSSYGRPLHFTETTFLSGKPGWELKKKDPDFDWVSTPDGELRQAEQVERFYTVLFSHPAVEAITWWDFSDYSAWQRAPAGFLRRDMSPKPSYLILKALIKGKWWTRVQTTITDQGNAHFRGFYGDYKVTVGTGDMQMVGLFSFNKNTPAPIMVRMDHLQSSPTSP